MDLGKAITLERVYSIDVLRGVAVLGILLVNIIGFGLPWAAYNNPSAFGGDMGLNRVFWYAQLILFDGKMRAIFSMLFGASVILMTRRDQERGGSSDFVDRYYRRTLWLMAIGMLHAYLISESDILFTYGLVGLALFSFRRMRPRTLILLGFLLLSILAAKALWQGRSDLRLRERATAAAVAEARGVPLTPRQRDERLWWSERQGQLKLVPDTASIQENIQRQRGGYRTNLRWRMQIVPELESRAIYDHDGYDVAGMMLIGMGLMLLGVLSGERRTIFYIALMTGGYAVGITICSLVAWVVARGHFQSLEGEIALRSTEDVSRLAVALGHIAVVVLFVRSGWWSGLARRLAAAGKMALSNYLLSSLVCALYFCGYGFGMFARLQRYQLLYVVVGVWLLILVWSPWWLRHFRFGPVEWSWRSLTRWQRQPMRLLRSSGGVDASAF